MASIRDEAARQLFDWIENRYRASGSLLNIGVGNASDAWAAIRIPTGEVGLLKIWRIVAVNGVEDPHIEVHWTLDVIWSDGYGSYTERDNVVWTNLTNLTNLPMSEDAPLFIERPTRK